MITKRHTYNLIYKITRSGFVFLAFVYIVLGIFLVAGFIASLIEGIGFDSSSIKALFGDIFGVAVWAPILFLFMAYLFTDISANEDGMDVQFLWKTYRIKWEAIIEVKPFRPFGLFTNKKWDVVIVKTKLTLLHRLYGIIYGGKNQTAILIYRKIGDYDLLIKNISMHAKNNSAKSKSTS